MAMHSQRTMMPPQKRPYILTSSAGSGAAYRITGYDFARSFAILGMAVINFIFLMADFTRCSPPAKFLIYLIYGKASAMFVILAGIGISLLSARARLNRSVQELTRLRHMLLKRSLFLFITGLCFTAVWPADILHFYGIYIAVGAFLMGVEDRCLLKSAAAFALFFTALLFFLNYEIDMGWELIDDFGNWKPQTFVRNLFFNGYHPVFPWTAFLLLGMWFGRQNVSNSGFRKKVLAIGCTVFCAVELLSRLIAPLLSDITKGSSPGIPAMLLQTSPMPPSPFYLISSGAASLMMITVCISLTEQQRVSRYLKPFAAAGQLSLTLYVTHILSATSLIYFFEVIGEFEDTSTAVMFAVLFYAAAVVISHIWQKRFGRGPLEYIMRLVSKSNHIQVLKV